jgi:hypothetical protein
MSEQKPDIAVAMHCGFDGRTLLVAEHSDEKGAWLTLASLPLQGDGPSPFVRQSVRMRCPTSMAWQFLDALKPNADARSGCWLQTASPPFDKPAKFYIPAHAVREFTAAVETIAKRHEERRKQAASAA